MLYETEQDELAAQAELEALVITFAVTVVSAATAVLPVIVVTPTMFGADILSSENHRHRNGSACCFSCNRKPSRLVWRTTECHKKEYIRNYFRFKHYF